MPEPVELHEVLFDVITYRFLPVVFRSLSCHTFSKFAAKLLQILQSRPHPVRIRQRALKFFEFVVLQAPKFARLGCRHRHNFCLSHVRLFEKPY